MTTDRKQPVEPQRLLYVEDNHTAARLFQIKLQQEGYVVDLAKSGSEGLAMLERNEYDLIALDQNIPDRSGLEILQTLTARRSAPPIIMITAQNDTKTAVEAMKLGASDYVVKGLHNEYLQLLPAVVRQTLDKRKLEHERDKTLEELQQNNRRLLLLNRVAQLLTSTLDLEQVIQQLVRTISELLDTEGSSVWLWDETHGHSLICVGIYSHGQNITPDSILRLKPGQGIAGWVALHGKSVHTGNVKTDARFTRDVDDSTGFETQSLLAVPLQSQNKTIGVLELVNKRYGPFDESDSVIAETLAASAAIAIENARLMKDIRQHRDELQARNEELDAFAHTVAHDLKNPLTLVVGFADMLRDLFPSMPQTEVEQYLNIIIEHGKKMGHIIEALLLLAVVRGTKEVEIDEIDMGFIVAETLRRIEFMVKEYNAEVIVPPSWPTVYGYGQWLEEVWYNYLTNGLKYGGRPPRLELGYELINEKMARFWVKDNGAGFSIDQPEKLFTPLSKLTPSDYQTGHGLGLSIVRRIVERLGGKVGVESKLGEGSKFYFTLPTESGAANTA
ncbi:MAG: hybrid sensor histidine kinase/response regulator [Caldilinea sp. CFX5]|nr:hybrid sensor histidine kinase/response regulator [Caldilinea sp. CFX5]